MSPNEPSLPSSVIDLAILARLFEEHRPKLVAMVQRRMDPRLAARVGAEEVVNEAFLVAGRRWPASTTCGVGRRWEASVRGSR